MKMRLFLLAVTAWAVANTEIVPNVHGGDHIVKLTSQYRTRQAYGNLGPDPNNGNLAGQYFAMDVCREEGGIELIAITVIIPGNAAFRNETWDYSHGLVDIQVATHFSFRPETIVTSNYGGTTAKEKAQQYAPWNRVVFRYSNFTFGAKTVYIRAKSFRATERVILEVEYEKETPENQPTPYTKDVGLAHWNKYDAAKMQMHELVQFAQTNDPNLYVSGDDFIYFEVKFCSQGMASVEYMTATAVGLPRIGDGDKPTQTALNMILCNPTTMAPYTQVCVNPTEPLVVAYDFSASPVVSIKEAITGSSSINIQDFIIGIQGQGGYRSEDNGVPGRYDEGVNNFNLAIQLS